jgi:phosphatidylinositol glycan class V
MHHHKRILLLLAAVVRALSALLLIAISRLPSFDTSAEVVLGKSWYTPLLRWDVFHFAHVAEHGYVYEYEWAFYPGLPILLRYTSKLLGNIGSDGYQQMLIAGALVAMCADSTLTLYALTEQLFHSRSFAFLASLLSLLPSSPATLRHAAYTEPFFTYLSYKGKWLN